MAKSEIIRAIEKYLREDDWNFTTEGDAIRTKVSIEGKLNVVSMIILVNDTSYTSYGKISLNADNNSKAAVAEFLTRANYGIRNGCFEMDYTDGELRYRTYVNCENQLPSTDIIASSILTPPLMFQKYGDGLVAVVFGFQKPEDAIRQIEG